MKSEETDSTGLSRRRIVAGAITMVAALPAASENAQGASLSAGAGRMPIQDQVRNPVNQYPHPPFEKQPQPWPGLEAK